MAPSPKLPRTDHSGPGGSPRSLRCAIYTRKSTEEGLEQAFNSLDAQRDACGAYILSQAGEGWVAIPQRYDDGGYSGGNMERPALQRLLTDITAGRIDVVVVYKIDRLTRSLADFAKIVERLDARGASFVSVTQAFNTTTSMGRLTLNVLLSFAQFEREVGAERVRDKIAASRKRGIWMGGSPPLGYDVKDRKLVPNEAEADDVRWMFQRYLEVRSLTKLRAEIEGRGITTKTYVARTGRNVGGARWYVGPLRHLLHNRVYVGEAVHKGAAWPGEHDAIVDRTQFDAVQSAFDASRIVRRDAVRHSVGMLTGLVWDDAGNRMSPQTVSRNRQRLYGYYVSQAALQRRPIKGSLPRVSISKLDNLVSSAIDRLSTANARAASQDPDNVAARDAVRKLLSRVEVSSDRVVIGLRQDDLPRGRVGPALTLSAIGNLLPSAVVSDNEGQLTITVPADLSRRSTTKSLSATADWARSSARFDATLVRNLVLAHRCRKAIEAGEIVSVAQAGKLMGLARNNARLIMRLAWIAPYIQEAILRGRQSTCDDLGTVLRSNVSAAWNR